MLIDIIVPSAGESVSKVELARWLVAGGSWVEKDQEIAEIDSDKATLTINATQSGVLRILVDEGTEMQPGTVIGQIEVSAEVSSAKAILTADTVQSQLSTPPLPEAVIPHQPSPINSSLQTEDETNPPITFSPQAIKLLEDLGIGKPDTELTSSNRRITKKDVLAAISTRYNVGKQNEVIDSIADTSTWWSGGREENRQKMSLLRKKVAERLVSVKNQTAMLTSFNEVDMSAIFEIREKHKDSFKEKYGVKLGLMGFFIKALTESIPWFPQVNGRIEDNHLIIPRYADVGIAVSTPKGLMVPVIRNAERLSVAGIELKISELAEKARNNKISIEELSGGTISITNGGVFGSMLSTPIINPPQSAILGMHRIVDRPVAYKGRVEIRPIMYLALSYDHRIIDGRESVGFLIKIKEKIENPLLFLLNEKDPSARLLGLT
ncbi:MAG TPA: 2-oxoglutarate dehydrogenase complex dihydrolipoyllysine-residue succinyltransferase [Bacteroidales bacterium]|nr:2-oxoglutarate dehydrogenase complex dihydrolipoyllysine-residue succinyltransferase [Bacteroidales bacterium]